MLEEQTICTNTLVAPSIVFNPLAEMQNNHAEKRMSLRQSFEAMDPNETTLTQEIKAAEEEEKRAAAKRLEKIGSLLSVRLTRVNALIGLLSDEEAPNIGQDFLERMSETNCVIEMDPKLEHFADYKAYENGVKTKTFINYMGIPPSKLQGDIYPLSNSYRHEALHAMQTLVAEALHHTPFNSDTKIVVHPVDFIKLVKVCEADAYAKQAFFNYLDAQDVPEIRKTSAPDLVSVEDFEKHRHGRSLKNALIDSALNALLKAKIVTDPNYTFEDHYHNNALDNYRRGMSNRIGEKDIIYVRLEPEDFFEIGSYEVGPNALGHRGIDPYFIEPPRLSKADNEKLHAILDKHSIPPLQDCPTLAEVKQPRAMTQNHQYAQQMQSSFNSPQMS